MMEYDYEALEKALITAIGHDAQWHNIGDLARSVLGTIGRKRVSEALKQDIFQICEYAFTEGTLLRHPCAVEFDDLRYTSWTDYFRGKSFRISLTPLETEKGVLIPGHRLSPFLSSGIQSIDARIFFRGKPLPRTTITIPVADALIYVSLLGLVRAGVYISLQNPDLDENQDVPIEDVDLTVVDWRRVRKEYPAATQFVLCSRDLDQAEFEIVKAVDSEEVLDFGASMSAVQALDHSLETVFEEFPPGYTDLEHQLAAAFVLMPDSFFTDPPFHLGGYLKLSRQVRIAPYGLDTILWRRNEEPEDAPGAIPPNTFLDAYQDFLDDDH